MLVLLKFYLVRQIGDVRRYFVEKRLPTSSCNPFSWTSGLMRKIFFVTLGAVVLAGTLLVMSNLVTQAQSNDGDWSQPTLLFETVTPNMIFVPVVIADRSGQVHILWDVGESRPQLIYYTHWNGLSWSEPVDIQASSTTSAPSATVDLNGTIHLLWSDAHQLYYSRVSAGQAASARNWTKPAIIAEANQYARILADPTGRLHIVYPGPEESGPYYQTSKDGGNTWSSPVNISPTRAVALVSSLVTRP